MSVISQFMHNPKDVHFQAAYRVLRYLKSTLRKGILFKKSVELSLEAYIDAGWDGLVVDRRLTLGHCTVLEGNLVTWRSKKQIAMASSSVKVEFRVVAHSICEFLWLKIILDDLKIK